MGYLRIRQKSTQSVITIPPISHETGCLTGGWINIKFPGQRQAGIFAMNCSQDNSRNAQFPPPIYISMMISQGCQNKYYHYNDVIMSPMTIWITGVSIGYSTACSGVDHRNIKAPRHWPLWGEFTGDLWIPHTKGQLHGKCFHLMTSSCFDYKRNWLAHGKGRESKRCNFLWQHWDMESYIHIILNVTVAGVW